MLVLYSASTTVVSSVASLCFIFKLIKSRKLMFYGVHSCLSPVEIQDVSPPPPHTFGIPIVTMPPCLWISSSKTPLPLPNSLALQIPKSCLWYGMVIFWNCPIHQNYMQPCMSTYSHANTPLSQSECYTSNY